MSQKVRSLKTKKPWTPGVRSYQGSCRCGAIRFEVELDLSEGTTQCNCSVCWTTRWWGILVRPPAFRLIAAGPTGDPLASKVARRGRCDDCGVVPYGHGDIPELGGEFYSINMNCLDNVDLDGVPVRYVDGLNDTWATLSEAPYVDPYRKREAAWRGGGATTWPAEQRSPRAATFYGETTKMSVKMGLLPVESRAWSAPLAAGQRA